MEEEGAGNNSDNATANAYDVVPATTSSSNQSDYVYTTTPTSVTVSKHQDLGEAPSPLPSEAPSLLPSPLPSKEPSPLPSKEPLLM